jgi:hypothetical protein
VLDARLPRGALRLQLEEAVGLVIAGRVFVGLAVVVVVELAIVGLAVLMWWALERWIGGAW